LTASLDVLVLCDERRARRACEELGITVTGSIGLITEAFRAGNVKQPVALQAVLDLPKRGRLHLSPRMLRHALAALGVDPEQLTETGSP
jgi:predicted nucleic acid-binding protein